MIVKKIAILQGFPDLHILKNFLSSGEKTEKFTPVFYDIETTGLSRYSTFLYLIGAVKYEEKGWYLYQWMAEKEEEEPLLLNTFSDFLKGCTHTIQYNGDRFDQPYLEARYAVHNIISPFSDIPSTDLYQTLKPLSPLLKLAGTKQKDMEAFLGREKRSHCSGKECIRIYQSYLRQNTEKEAQTLLGHNQEDLIGLGSLIPMLGYLSLYQGNYSLQSLHCEDGQIFPVLTLPFSLPRPISNGNKEFYLTAAEKEARLSIPMKDGKLRLYYENYKDYAYLPAEDTAISKSLSAFMDKKLYVPAKPETCYTWFSCSEEFLSNPVRQEQYIHRALPRLLASLKTQTAKTK